MYYGVDSLLIRISEYGVYRVIVHREHFAKTIANFSPRSSASGVFRYGIIALLRQGIHDASSHF